MFKPVDKAAGQHACYSLMFTGFLHCEFFPQGEGCDQGVLLQHPKVGEKLAQMFLDTLTHSFFFIHLIHRTLYSPTNHSSSPK